MKVSIITVCLNNEDTIETTIASVEKQKYENIEHVFIDGCSNDDTLKIIKEKSSKAIVVSEKDSGIYDALNKGLNKATGDIIGILHADDFYANSYVLSETVENFTNSKADALYGDLNYVDRNDTSKVIRYWKSGRYAKGMFLKGWMPPHPTFFVKKEVYEKYGNFNTELRSAADYELMLRLIHKHEIKLTYLERVMINMRTGGQSNITISNRIKANIEDRKAWKLNDLKPHWYTLYFKPVRKISQYFSFFRKDNT